MIHLQLTVLIANEVLNRKWRKIREWLVILAASLRRALPALIPSKSCLAKLHRGSQTLTAVPYHYHSSYSFHRALYYSRNLICPKISGYYGLSRTVYQLISRMAKTTLTSQRSPVLAVPSILSHSMLNYGITNGRFGAREVGY